jgi:tetratricopeptide (TPR) repeat protein
MNRHSIMKLLQHSIVLAIALGAAVMGAAGIVGCSSSANNGPTGIRRYVQAVQAYNKGDRPRAVANLVSATRLNPDLIMARALLGDLYRADGKYEQAAAQYEALVKLDPYTASNFYRLGVSYQFLQRLNDAAQAYQKALKLEPDDANSNMNLGMIKLYLGDVDAAVRLSERATLLNPGSAAAFSNLGVALDARGDYPRAEAAYRHSLDIDPDNMTTLTNLGINLIAQERGDEAVEIMAKVLKSADNPLNHKRYGDALTAAGRFDDARGEYDLALKRDPTYYPAMNGIGFAWLAQYRKGLELDDAQRRQAIDQWKKSLATNPNQPNIQAAINEWTQDMFNRK